MIHYTSSNCLLELLATTHRYMNIQQMRLKPYNTSNSAQCVSIVASFYYLSQVYTTPSMPIIGTWILSRLATCLRFKIVLPVGSFPTKWDGPSTSTPTSFPWTSTKASKRYPLLVTTSSSGWSPMDDSWEMTPSCNLDGCGILMMKASWHFSQSDRGSLMLDFSSFCHSCHWYSWVSASTVNSSSFSIHVW